MNPRIDLGPTNVLTGNIAGYFSGGTPGQLACNPTACSSTTFPWTGALSQSSTSTCSAAATNNGGTGVTTLATSGFVEYAQYLVRTLLSHPVSPISNCLSFNPPHFSPQQTYPTFVSYTTPVMNSLSNPLNNVPYVVNEFPIQSPTLCGAYGAGLPLNDPSLLWSATTSTTTVQGSQTVVYTTTFTKTINGIAQTITSVFASQLYYSTTACTGNPIGIYTYLSDRSSTVIATGVNTKIVVAGSNVNTGIWVASASFVSGLTTVPYQTSNYYASQAGCTSSTKTTLTWTQYKFPGFGYVFPFVFVPWLAASSLRLLTHPSFPSFCTQVQRLRPVRGPQPARDVRDGRHAHRLLEPVLRQPAALVRRRVQSSLEHQPVRPDQPVHGRLTT